MLKKPNFHWSNQWLARFKLVAKQYEYYGQGFREIGAGVIVAPLVELFFKKELAILSTCFSLASGLVMWYIGSILIIKKHNGKPTK